MSLPSITLNAPLGVSVDPSGNLYVVDSGNERVIQSTAGGVSVLKYNGPSSGQFVFGVAPDGQGNLLISDFSNNRLVFVNRTSRRRPSLLLEGTDVHYQNDYGHESGGPTISAFCEPYLHGEFQY